MSHPDHTLVEPLQRASQPVKVMFGLVGALTVIGYAFVVGGLPVGFHRQFGDGFAAVVRQPGFVILAGLTVLADLYPLAPWLPRSRQIRGFAWSTLLSVAGVITYGPWAALLFPFSGFLQRLPRAGVRWRQTSLNTVVVGCQGLQVGIACAGIRSVVGGPSDVRLLLVGLTATAVMITTTSTVVGAVTPCPRERRTVLRGVFVWGLSLLVAPVAAIIAVTHPLLLPLLGIAIIALHHASDSFAERMEQALTDPLTGLANRAALMEQLDRSQRNPADEPLSVIVIDLDGFKAVNDRFGHVAGDQVLIAVAQRLGAVAGPQQLVGRFGGDEFVVVAPGADPDQVQGLATRIDEAVREPIEVGGRPLMMTASVGLATSADERWTPVDLIAAADRAMYQRKFGRPGRRRLRPGTGSKPYVRQSVAVAQGLTPALSGSALPLQRHHWVTPVMVDGPSVAVQQAATR